MTQTDSTKNTEDIRILTGNHAAAHAFRQARVGVISAYPITPQSPVVEKISEFINEGQLKARFLMVESEHSAAAACCAASATGSRVGTATSAHGLMLMYEMLPWASGTRLPIVINLATRSLKSEKKVNQLLQIILNLEEVNDVNEVTRLFY